MSEGRIQIFTGTGRGKTSAAFGTALRHAAQGESVVIIQFLKRRAEERELEFYKRLEPEIRIFRFERGEKSYLTCDEKTREEETENIRNGLGFARKVLDTAECDLLIMDEVLGLVDNHIITTGELGELLGHRGETEVILTGITLDDEMLSYADEISEISPVNFRKFGSAEKEQDTEGGNHVSI
jgi:cob(I)alamin adenosyltransferase